MISKSCWGAYSKHTASNNLLFSSPNPSRTRCAQFLRHVMASKRVLHTDTNIPEYHEGRLEGTAPDHLCYILLHSSHSPETFPSVYHTTVSRELQLRAMKWGGLVNFSWIADKTAGEIADRQPATVFSPLGGKLDISNVSVQNMDEIEELVKRHIQGPLTSSTSQDMHIYVCTHGARDCRCGDRGRQVYEALVEAVKKERTSNASGPASNLKIGEVGHVGGHKYAANVLLFPQGDWLGIVKPEDAPAIVSEACEALQRGIKPLDHSAPPLFPSHWRGRMGLSREEQKSLWSKYTGHE
ncbi:Sucrase/ferredoxin-like-domain-containing protein [Gymnopilus junonius]|uniref:Sucrase/ferredoxin-like-domain-containing protein n=1 Tax=Gymnopilus junonius TaxID=109634 RepID=A0A9P5TIC9_GYMJU|nr:Sucrase/ferredoxin-like-domain-containing protein [Gymnopilus junonius]